MDEKLPRNADLARFVSSIGLGGPGGCWLWEGTRQSTGYGVFKFGGLNAQLAHRLAYQLFIGPIPEGGVIDHKCHRRECVNPRHLRPCTFKQNSENRQGASSRSKSGIRGVHWSAASGKWHAQVASGGKRYHVGLFTDLDEAEAAVIAKRNEVFTHNQENK